MDDRQDLLKAIRERLDGLPEEDTRRLLQHIEALIDDRVAMGMSEAAAVSALGDPEALIRDAKPNAVEHALAGSSADYRETPREILIHVKNTDVRLRAAPLPEGVTAQIRASEDGAFTWSMENGVLALQEVGATRRALFQKERTLELILWGCRPEKLIADGYGGDLHIEGVEIGELTVLAASSGDIRLNRFRCGGRTEVTTRSGNIVFHEVAVTGDCKLETMSGDIELSHAKIARLRLRAASGDARVEGLRGSVAALGTTSGDIELVGLMAEASILCESDSGDINLRGSAAPDMRLATSRGDIDVLLPAALEGYEIQAESRGGETRVAPSSPTGARPCTVHAVSVSGDISIAGEA